MYENIGGKIKGLAVWIFGIGAMAAIIWGIVFASNDEDLVGIGFLIMIMGSILSWASSLTLYGFGELIEKTSAIALKIGTDEFEESDENV